MNKIGIYINESLKDSLNTNEIIDILVSYSNVRLYCSEAQKVFIPHRNVSAGSTELDCVLVFGGDGTILSAVDYALESKAPILGINSGKLGFLSDFSLVDFPKYIGRLFLGEFNTLERMMISASVIRSGKQIYSGYALNDAVIYKGLVSRLIDIRLNCSGKFVLETRCDGMIAATPTGSTAYSLSAGGPIMSPEMEALIVAALCPHVLSVRPMVFSAKDTLVFKMAKVYNETMLQIDGKNVQALVDNDAIVVRPAREKVSFITLTGKSFYQTLRKKLHMGKL